MARPFWKGAISFGMVVIPVRMYVATERSTPAFHFLHKKCYTRPKQIWYCPVDDEYFTSKDTVRGYEYTKGKYVVLHDSDFDKVPVKTTHSIDIFGFADMREIDPIYYQDSHYLEPDELGVKPFSLLREALVKMQRVGLAKVAFQRREHLCCLRPADGTVVLHTLHYQDEIRSVGELTQGKEKVRQEELKMATTLVEAMSTTFEPEKYRDEYQEALHEIIEAKVKGEEVKVPKVEEAEIPDLMTALKQSIEQAQREKEHAGARK